MQNDMSTSSRGPEPDISLSRKERYGEVQGEQTWKHLIKDVVRFHHRSHVFRLLAALSKTYLRAYHNENHYRFEHNGECFVIETMKNVKDGLEVVAFDVGAHTGLWTREFLKRFPDAQLHCFEIAPQTFKRLATELQHYKNVTTNSLGLSAQEGSLTLRYIPGATTISTVHEAMLATKWHLDYELVPARVITGDKYVAERNIDRIDVLKIDTEGHELSVLRGFSQTLERRPIPLIQFEHGFVHIPARTFLCDLYDFLTPLGYLIGRLYPTCVQFNDYDLCEDEQFRMCNYIAVHRSENELVTALQKS